MTGRDNVEYAIDRVVEQAEALFAEARRAAEGELKLVDNLVIIAAELGAEASYDAVIARVKELRAIERAHLERTAQEAEDRALLKRLLGQEPDPACPES